MIPSLPLITPHDAHLLWYTPSTTNTTTSPSFLEPHPTTTTYNNNNNPNPPPPHHPPRRPNPNNNTTRSRLAQVQHSRHLLTQRKQNIRRFGSTWIRPPGVGKTYQAMMDEAAEREEQVAEAERELRLLEEQEAAEEEEAEAMGMGMGALEEGGGEVGMGERDLDEDVPEAGEGEEEGGEEGFSGEEEVGGDGDEGVLGEGVGDGVGGIGGEGVDRDLDEDVPEAGSYQHTDTEVEDESSQDGGEGSRGIEETRRVSAARSEGSSSVLLGSSVVGSSPGVGRQSSGPFARRLGGREN
ncbi:MAG: hypothetical protein M1835_001752 [Candelina submexicana]|nr:MAG: hypothetical protein M1835_001752 [Candelina submexicana]